MAASMPIMQVSGKMHRGAQKCNRPKVSLRNVKRMSEISISMLFIADLLQDCRISWLMDSQVLSMLAVLLTLLVIWAKEVPVLLALCLVMLAMFTWPDSAVSWQT